MKNLIIYSSKHGFTKKCAEMLKEGLKDGGDLINLKENQKIDLDNYQVIILGSSVYAGNIQKDMKDFIEKNHDALMEKNTGLFTCNMHKGQEAEEQLKKVYPLNLVEKSFMVTFFGGSFDFKKMNFIEKQIVKKIAKVSESVETIEVENIRKMQEKVNSLV